MTEDTINISLNNDNIMYAILPSNPIRNFLKSKKITDNPYDLVWFVTKNKELAEKVKEYFEYDKDTTGFPKWKIDYIKKNKAFYLNHKDFIDSWLHKYDNLSEVKPTHRKMEWQAGKTISSIFEGLIQFRQSGIRIKKPDAYPTLVAVVQTSIVGKYARRLTPRECARLQDFPDDFELDNNEKQAYKQFGNSVNVKVIRSVYEELLKY